jgi:alanine racemase
MLFPTMASTVCASNILHLPQKLSTSPPTRVVTHCLRSSQLLARSVKRIAVYDMDPWPRNHTLTRPVSDGTRCSRHPLRGDDRMEIPRIRPTRAEVDLGALVRNVRTLRSAAPGIALLAMVKADAYGHGASLVAPALEAEGVELLGVALIEEGLALRLAGVRGEIVVLGGAYEGGWEALVEANLLPAVFREDHLEALAKAARRLGAEPRAHLKVDTGMARLGALPDEVPPLLARARTLGVNIEGVMSHFANADLGDAVTTKEQMGRFEAVLADVDAAGLRPRWRHFANSAAMVALAPARDGTVFNLVRPGLALYGVSPAAWIVPPRPLEPVLTWKTAVVHLKTVATGTPVSYGGTWTSRRPTRIATLPVGYADGYPRRLSNRAQVLVRGQRAPVVGRVCMDLCMVDVTDVAGAALGDEVVLLGHQGLEDVGAAEVAGWLDSIPYEVLCGVGARVPRVAVRTAEGAGSRTALPGNGRVP